MSKYQLAQDNVLVNKSVWWDVGALRDHVDSCPA
jgi:hypothetical protein